MAPPPSPPAAKATLPPPQQQRPQAEAEVESQPEDWPAPQHPPTRLQNVRHHQQVHSSYGTMDRGSSPEPFTQVRVPRGSMGAPRTVMDGGLLLRSLDQDNDGRLDQREAQQISRGAEVVSQGEFEHSFSPMGAAVI